MVKLQMVTESEILKSLSNIINPITGQDLVTSASVKDVQVSGDRVAFSLETSLKPGPEKDHLKDRARSAVLSVPGVKNVSITVLSKSPMAERAAGHVQPAERILNIKYVIPVASGKGGVGKSTVSANLAIALSKLGYRVGLMDADVYGPSIPTLMGIHEPPRQEDGKISPHVRYGIKLISMGFFLPKGEAVIWRGPMLHKMIDQFLGSVNWGELDFLMIDLPPGTGDIQLSLCQKIPLTGAVIVSTPQDLAFQVAEKAIFMFEKLHTPVLGMIENMSGYVCKNCGSHEEIFGSGGAREYAKSHRIAFLGAIPLAADIRISSDGGKPVVEAENSSASAQSFIAIAKGLVAELQLRERGEKSDTSLFPREINQPGKDKIEIIWHDGHESRYNAFDLRLACPCAMCIDENTGRRLIRRESIRKDVQLSSMDRVGRYGVTFRWSDGHATGIYTFEYLRRLCSCPACRTDADAKTGVNYGIAR
ncbi:MAG: P-loop NTPase [Candidatus Omnitrophica bacterium]|nr:P-loop NTPase [Candidatus Omnitrophota bacterium]